MIIPDSTPLLARSIRIGKPIVIVTFNYRLNIFSFGDGSSENNLALKDQRLAISWVTKHIAGFGGDKVCKSSPKHFAILTEFYGIQNNMTLAGESAGAVYAHAHLSTAAPVRRGILQSGSLYLSPPLPVERGKPMIKALADKIQERDHVSLAEAPVEVLLRQLKENNINTMWIQEEPDLENWEQRVNDVPELLIGDVEFEVRITASVLSHSHAVK